MANRVLNVQITGNANGLNQPVNSALAQLAALGQAAQVAGTSIGSGISSGTNQASGALGRFNASSSQSAQHFNTVFGSGIGQTLSRVSSALTSFGAKLTATVTIPLALLGGQAFQTYANIDSLKLGLQSVTGSAVGAEREFSKLREIARLPGIGLEESVAGSLRLQALGFSADRTRNILAQLGNALATTGQGKFDFGNILTQFSQMASKSSVLTEDLKPIINSSSVISRAIREMFGSINAEEISAKLKAAGRGPQQFIDDLTAKLATVPRAISGPKNAIENFGDSWKLAQNNIGQAVDKLFSVTGILNSVGNAIGSLADRFSGLPPSIQKTILVATAVVAIAGPLALSIGGLLAVLPAVAAGFALVSGAVGLALGPIALIGAGVAGAAYLIATNWDAIKQTLSDSGIWQSVTGLVGSAFDAIKSIVGLGVEVVMGYWNRFGSSLTTIAQGAFTLVAAIFNTGAGVLTGIFQVLGGALTGNWSKALQGIETIGRSILAGLVGLFQSAFSAIGGTIGYLFNLIGVDSIAKKFNDAAASGSNLLQGLQTRIRGVGEEVKKTQSILAKPAAVGAVIGKPYDYSNIGLGGSSLDKAKDRLKELKDLIGSGKLQGKDVSALQAEYDALSKRIDAATDSTRKQHSEASKVWTVMDHLLSTQKMLNSEIQEKRALGLAVDPNTLRSLEIVNRQIDRLKGKFEGVHPLKISGTGLDTLNMQGSQQRRDNFSLMGRASSEVASLSTQTNPQFRDLAEAIKQGGQQVAGAYYEMTQTIKTAAQATAVEMADGIGSVIGGIATGQVSALSGILNLITDFISNYLAKIGQAKILAGAAMVAAGALSFDPFLIAKGTQNVQAGGLLKVASGAVKVVGGALAAKAFAEGGYVTKPTYSLTGEYGGASLPGRGEWIAPVNKGAGIIADSLVKMGVVGNGNGGQQLVAVVSGSDLNFILKEYQRNK